MCEKVRSYVARSSRGCIGSVKILLCNSLCVHIYANCMTVVCYVHNIL